MKTTRYLMLGMLAVMANLPPQAQAHDLKALVKNAKAAIVGIGTRLETRRPPNVVMATGFVIRNGKTIVTNAHAIPDIKDPDFEHLVIFVGTGRRVEVRPVKVIQRDETHDLAVLRQSGPPLPALKVAPPEPMLAEGSSIAFIGYPIGSVLGLYPVTHGGFVSAITPIVIPAASSNSLSAAQVRALKNPYFVYQLDATAYPGNSGSPLFDVESGEVVGIINKVFVKSRKENVLSDPSAITYAIPVKFLHPLLK